MLNDHNDFKDLKDFNDLRDLRDFKVLTLIVGEGFAVWREFAIFAIKYI